MNSFLKYLYLIKVNARSKKGIITATAYMEMYENGYKASGKIMQTVAAGKKDKTIKHYQKNETETYILSTRKFKMPKSGMKKRNAKPCASNECPNTALSDF